LKEQYGQVKSQVTEVKNIAKKAKASKKIQPLFGNYIFKDNNIENQRKLTRQQQFSNSLDNLTKNQEETE
jgi:hypothetical protein